MKEKRENVEEQTGDEEIMVKYCTECGGTLQDEDTFCSMCGKLVSERKRTAIRPVVTEELPRVYRPPEFARTTPYSQPTQISEPTPKRGNYLYKEQESKEDSLSTIILIVSFVGLFLLFLGFPGIALFAPSIVGFLVALVHVFMDFFPWSLIVVAVAIIVGGAIIGAIKANV